MARPKKSGLDYFPLDSDFFSKDPKIKLLKARYGADGITLYIYLLCEIYKKGYYIKADEDFQFIVSDELKMSIDKVKQVLKFLLERSLFDNKLFQSDAVLTSTGIQKRFQAAVKERARKNLIEVDRFWLLNESETEPFIKVTHFAEKTGKNESYSGKNPFYSKEESLKKSKVNNYIYFSNPELNEIFLEYLHKREADNLTEGQVKALHMELMQYGKTDEERKAICRKALAAGWKSFYPLGQNSSNRPAAQSKKNAFHNFDQREYDYQALEKQFIQKVNGGK